MVRKTLVAGVLLVALAMVAPGGSAQVQDVSVTVKVDPVEDPIAPTGDPVTVPFEATLRRNVPAHVEDTRAEVTILSYPVWASVEPVDDVLVFETGPAHTGESESTVESALLVSVDQSAPAFHPMDICVRVTTVPTTLEATDAVALQESTHGDTCFPVAADFMPRTHAEFDDDTLRAPRGATATADLVVTNLGNGAVDLTFERVDAPEGVRVQVPDALALESLQTGGDHWRETLPVEVHFTADAVEGDVVLRVTSAYAYDKNLPGDETTATLHVVPDGATAAVKAGDAVKSGMPGFLALAGVGGGLWWRRRGTD